MADFAEWAVAAEPAFGVPEGTFTAAYTENREQSGQAALEASPIVEPLKRVVELTGGRFTGTATDLLNELNRRVDEAMRRRRDWPHSASGLSGMLNRLKPNLREIGLVVRNEKDNDKKRTRKLIVEREGYVKLTTQRGGVGL